MFERIVFDGMLPHVFFAMVVLDVCANACIYACANLKNVGTTSVVIRKNWNDTEKISMAPAQG